jgi:hypothetical protein
MKAVLDIPDASLLSKFNLEDLVQVFCLNSGVEKPDVICLPIYDEGGAQFDSKYTSKERSMWQLYSLEKEVQKIRKRYPNTQLYLSVMPTLPGVKAAHFSCRNQYGEEMSGACFVNPYVQQVILDIVLEASNALEPDGIVFDTVDIHGQSAKGKSKAVDISCFCNFCRDSMKDLKFDSTHFSQRISPLTLVLGATDTGIRFLTPKSNFTPEQLVDLAIKEEYIDKDDEKALRWAQVILDYIRVRSKVTGIALGELSQGIKARFPTKRVGAILNKASFDWTGGTDLHGIAGQVDEAWLDTDDLTADNVPPGLEVFAYAADRARYRIDAFFEIASDRRFLEAAVRREGVDYITGRLSDRLGQLSQVQNLDKTFVNSISKMKYLAGFVGIPFEKKIYQHIFEAAREEAAIMAADVQKKPSSFSKDLVKQYIIALVQYVEDGNELTKKEIVSLAAQAGFLD